MLKRSSITEIPFKKVFNSVLSLCVCFYLLTSVRHSHAFEMQINLFVLLEKDRPFNGGLGPKLAFSVFSFLK